MATVMNVLVDTAMVSVLIDKVRAPIIESTTLVICPGIAAP